MNELTLNHVGPDVPLPGASVGTLRVEHGFDDENELGLTIDRTATGFGIVNAWISPKQAAKLRDHLDAVLEEAGY